MLALSQGKHIYLEKPMCRTFFEAELMMAAARKRPNLSTQVGNQGHSDANYYQFKTWKDAGIIKDVTRIDVHMNSARRWHSFDSNIKKFPDAEPLPKNMNWDAWLGPTPWHDYNAQFHQGNWRCWYDLGMGALGDWGAHLIDTAHEFLELGLPYEIEMKKAEGHNDFFFPYSSTIFYRFGPRGEMPPVDLTWYDGVKEVSIAPTNTRVLQRRAVSLQVSSRVGPYLATVSRKPSLLVLPGTSLNSGSTTISSEGSHFRSSRRVHSKLLSKPASSWANKGWITRAFIGEAPAQNPARSSRTQENSIFFISS